LSGRIKEIKNSGNQTAKNQTLETFLEFTGVKKYKNINWKLMIPPNMIKGTSILFSKFL